MEYYYNLERIKDIFKLYEPSVNFLITEDEFDIFCKQIVKIPKEIVDRISKDIYFVLLSAEPKRTNAACLVDLNNESIKGKKALVVVTPILFGYRPGEIEPGPEYILHEIAHFIRGHCNYESQEDINKKEIEANKLASQWMADYFNAIDSENK